jgi:hypothetical protein
MSSMVGKGGMFFVLECHLLYISKVLGEGGLVQG